MRFSRLVGNDSAVLFCCETAVLDAGGTSNARNKEVTTNSRSNKIKFLPRIYKGVAAYSNAKKKRTLRKSQRPPFMIAITNCEELPPHKSDLAAEIHHRYRRTSVTDVADHFATILVLEIVVPEIIQRDPSGG